MIKLINLNRVSWNQKKNFRIITTKKPLEYNNK